MSQYIMQLKALELPSKTSSLDFYYYKVFSIIYQHLHLSPTCSTELIGKALNKGSGKMNMQPNYCTRGMLRNVWKSSCREFGLEPGDDD